MNFYENPPSSSHVVPCDRKEQETDMPKLTVSRLKIMEGKTESGGVKCLLRGPRHLYGRSVIHAHTSGHGSSA